MRFSDIELPSNKKFGFFFSFVFAAATLFFVYSNNFALVTISVLISILFFVVALVHADILLPLNKLWMWFGVLLGMIVSPVVLGIIFFGIFTPLRLMMRMSGRDELRLKFSSDSSNASHWIYRSTVITSGSYTQQF